MRFTRFVFLVGWLFSAILPASASAQVYSWKDASGKIHYGDRPPTEKQTDSRKLQKAPVATGDVDKAQKAATDRQFDQREKQAKAEDSKKKTAETPAQAKEREANCQQARANLAGLENGLIRFTHNAKGERVMLDGVRREGELAKARKAADSWCNPPK